MSKENINEIYELQSLVKVQKDKIDQLTERLRAAEDAIDSMIIYENKRPSFEYFTKRKTALDKYRSFDRLN